MKFIPLAFLLCLLSGLHTATLAQNKKTVELSGYVKDNFGNAVHAATISVENEQTKADYDGYFKFDKIAQDEMLTVVVTAVGFLTEKKTLPVGANSKLTLDILMREDSRQIDEVTIVGQTDNERHVQEISRSGFNVSVIDLNKFSNEAANLTQVLKRATGVTIWEDGGLGSNFVFRINGLDAKIFIDGVPMDNFGSSMSLNNIPVNLIDRIEIYKGVVPAFLGSDALGGAVNIITKRRARPFLDFSYSLGSFNTHQAAVVGTFTNPKNKLSVRLNAFFNHSDNDYKMYSEERYNVILRGERNNKLDTIDQVRRFYDAYTSAMGQIELGYRDKSWADQFYVGLTYSQNHKENQLGATINTLNVGQWTESNYWMPTLSYKKSDFIVKRLYADIFTSYSMDTRHVRDTAAYNYSWSGNWVPIGDDLPRQETHTKYDLSNYLARINLNYDFDEERRQSINVNYNYNSSNQKEYDMMDGYDRSGLPSSLGRHILGLAWQNQWFDKRLSNVLSAKYYRLDAAKDRDERVFDGNNELLSGALVHYKKAWDYYSLSLASRYRITRDGGWKLSYERAYNLPAMTQLFGDGVNGIANFDLKPERSDNLNTGFYYNTFIRENNFLNVDVTAFYRLAADYINTRVVYVNGEGYTQAYNIPGVKLYGLAAELKYGYKDLVAVTLNGSYDRAIDNKKFTDDNKKQVSLTYGQQIANRPWVYGSMDISLMQNDWFQSGSRVQLSYLSQYTHWFYLSESNLGSLASKDHIPTQTIHSAILSYSWSRNKYNVSFEARNLTDERAYDNFRLQKPGRAFYLKHRLSLM
ncbi:TonB-dependent receptor [Sphingobacterium bambusae]|uniref:TonB-dependent receptor plug domain-containing protein n=1 Tax=Sphingobacterium bambusae TaxID=662858 RepID=A0ABW6BKM8_9SPHI|nr:TonB-dependent receptor plug domain-containing protein [Sphingobacterium bambusae]WPL49067.1 TonB-dependent receptor plug domain-containing protein [Sphingobacterium bambusae]